MAGANASTDLAFRRVLLSEEEQRSIEKSKGKRRKRASNFASHVSPIEAPPLAEPSAPVLLSTSLQALRLNVLFETDPLRIQRHSFRLQVESLSVFGTALALMGFMISPLIVILPRSVALAGWIQVVTILFISFACTKTTSYLVQSIDHCKETIDETICTWDDVVNVAFNRFGKISWCVLSILQLFATGLTFIILAGNHILYAYYKTISHTVDHGHEDLNLFTISNTALIFLCIGATLCVLSSLPLSVRARLHSLGVCLSVFVAVCVFVAPFLQYWCEKHWNCSSDYFRHNGRECSDGTDEFVKPRYIPMGMMVAMFCMGGHTPVAQTINRAMYQPDRFRHSHNTASVLSLCLFLLCSITGAYFFGPCTHDEITTNLFHINFHDTINVGRVLCVLIAVSALCTATTYLVPFASFFSNALGTSTRFLPNILVTIFAIALEVLVAWFARGDVLTAASFAGALTTVVSVMFPNVVFAVLRWEALDTYRRVYLVSVICVSACAMLAGLLTSVLRQAHVKY